MEENSTKKLIVSSPDSSFIKLLHQLIRKKDTARFGEMEFSITNSYVFDIKIHHPLRFVTMTPVITRIKKSIYSRYDLDLKHPYEYIFWRKDYPLELFLEQTEYNLRKKYLNYYQQEAKSSLKFTKFVFKKQIAQKLLVRDTTQTIIGTLWEFWFDENNELVKFGLDSGFGERNSMGFGFLNQV